MHKEILKEKIKESALTKENYLQSIKDAGFQNIEILNEKTYMDENHFNDGRKSSV